MTTETMMEPGPGLQGQLMTVLSLYQVLTNLHFLLVEQRASTSASSIRSVLSSQTNQLTSLIQSGLPQLSSHHQARLQQAAILTSNTSMALTSEEVAIGLQVVDEVLAELIIRAQRHARNQKCIQELVKEVQQRDENMKTTIKNLSLLREQCYRLVQLGDEEVKSMNRAEKNPISYQEILNYARKLSQTTTAPPGFKLQVDEDDMEEDEAEGAESSAQTKKSLYGRGEEDVNQGKAGRVPAHLQEKLPYPSENALRRSVMSEPLMSWDAFQRSFQTGDEEEQHQQQQQDGHLNDIRDRPTALNQSRTRPPAEEDDDGFGLDLN